MSKFRQVAGERKEAALTEQDGQQQQVCFVHVSNGQGSCESEAQTRTVPRFLGGRGFFGVLPAAADEDVEGYCGRSTYTQLKPFLQAEKQCLVL